MEKKSWMRYHEFSTYEMIVKRQKVYKHLGFFTHL